MDYPYSYPFVTTDTTAGGLLGEHAQWALDCNTLEQTLQRELWSLSMISFPALALVAKSEEVVKRTGHSKA